jgi:hypothetical protein
MGLLRLATEEINAEGLVAGVFLACAYLADALKVIMLLRIWIFGGN